MQEKLTQEFINMIKYIFGLCYLIIFVSVVYISIKYAKEIDYLILKNKVGELK